ncbi:hypothetical protein PGT21_001041 [Puccinia graminis f. sp. tritici]|uniref:Tet-like 2OG-Fe(II) oxygenase domain-containing protein n=1 Tax=Puccinia graminis f. sp. tritici TaxID=56615 RepID=A0A5B0MSN7_PUCGR|nr:hypothetical protein PGT21_001041 [Puccinia graminis f. sp. tritici]
MTFHPDYDSDSTLSDVPSEAEDQMQTGQGGPAGNKSTTSTNLAVQVNKKRHRNENFAKKRRIAYQNARREFITDLPPNCGSVTWEVRVRVQLDLFQDITTEYRKLKLERKKAQKAFKDGRGPQPPKDPIYRRTPTLEEIESANSIVTDPKKFRLYDHGLVHMFDRKTTKEKEKRIIAEIKFTDLKTISDQMREDLNFFLGFLHQSKKFVNTVGSESRSCGGYMWAIGWRKSMTHLEIVGRYVNSQAIKDNPDEFIQHVRDADRASQILWDLFFPMGNKALEANRQFMIEHNLPSFSDQVIPGTTPKEISPQADPDESTTDLSHPNPEVETDDCAPTTCNQSVTPSRNEVPDTPAPINKNPSNDTTEAVASTESVPHNEDGIPDTPELPHNKFFSSNLTFTSDGFYNHPHKDGRDDERLPFAFLLCVPTFKDTGLLAMESDGYDVKGGQFVFPQCAFGIDFKPDTMVQMIFDQRNYTHGTLKPEENGNFTKLGMSLQIARRTTNILDRVLLEEFVKDPKKFIADIPYILEKAEA